MDGSHGSSCRNPHDHDQYNEAAETHSSSCASIRRLDSFNIDARTVSSDPAARGSSTQQASRSRTLILAFQCVGVIYGDIATSPLYVFSATFPNGIGHNKDILGVLSLIL